MSEKTLIIAEAGVNHNGSLKTAIELIEVASAACADIVKFQTFTAEELASPSTKKAEYQKILTGADESQYEMIKKLQLDRDAHREIMKHCQKKGIEFLSTPFDHASIELLHELKLKRFKVPSGEITNLPYLRHIGMYGKPIMLSAGMATLTEIEAALQILERAGTPRREITVLHCNTEYPTPMEDVNLNAMLTIRDELGIQVGYSDHTLGIEIPISAVALGAKVIEKHFTIDRSLPGPDHHASLEPDELEIMMQAIRNVEQAKGDGIKQSSPSEKKNIAIVRKSIVAAREIKKGEKFTEENLAVKRPGTGISPMQWDVVLCKSAGRNYQPNDFISI